MGLNYPKDQGTEWFNLNQKVKNAFTSANSRVPYQKIAAGILKVSTSLEILAGAFLKFSYNTTDDGLFIGSNILFSGSTTEGMYIKRNHGGGASFTSLFDITTGAGFTGIWDSNGNIVVSDDSVAAQGLARPWLSVSFMNTSEYATPPAARQTTNTTDTTVVSAFFPAQHPKMHFVAYVSNPGAGTNEYKFKDGSGTTLFTGTSTGGFVSGDFSLTGFNFGDDYQMDLTIRRSAGAGAVGITLITLAGRQS